MPLRTAALLSAILLVWLPTALCHEDACLGEIRSGFERLQGQLTVFGDIRSGLERLHGQLTVFHNQLSVANQCPSGWSLHKNSCYLIPEVTATWLGANSICPSIDSRARLASVHLDNHQFLADMVAASDAEYVFVGGARLKLEPLTLAGRTAHPSTTPTGPQDSQTTKTGSNIASVCRDRRAPPTAPRWDKCTTRCALLTGPLSTSFVKYH